MDTIKVKKTDLIERLTVNREQHRDLFLQAQKGYQERIVEELDKELSRARQGKQPAWRAINLPVPKDHTKDYDAVLDMLGMDVRDEIELTTSDFRRYVRDEWQWREEFINTTSTYNG